MTKKIIITSDGRKKCDIKINEKGFPEINKETFIINDESVKNAKGKSPKSRNALLMQIRIGNPDAEIIEE